MSYRLDHRTPEEFAADIKECTHIEHKLMAAYVKDLSARKGGVYTFVPSNGQANGEYIADNKKVSTKADFVLTCPDSTLRRIEIKFCRDNRKDFRIKSSQLKSYAKQDCCIVTFMGAETDNPRYTVILPSDMPDLLEKYPDEYFHPWKKDVKRILAADCYWYPVGLI